MQGDPVRVTVRFSNGGANPKSNDAQVGDGRGMAVKFYLPDGSTSDIVGLSIPVFFVRTPEEFLEFTLARAESFEKVGEFIGSHPPTAAALQLIVPPPGPPRRRRGLRRCSCSSPRWFRRAATRPSPTTRFTRSSWSTPMAGSARCAGG